MPYVAPVVASAAGALVLLLSGCVAFATFKPRGARPSASARSIVSPTARRPLNRVASAPSASRTV
jgi:hypothetical protein